MNDKKEQTATVMLEEIPSAKTVSDKAQADKLALKKTAYALNMLTVSVSQIVDYNDIFILEQEYDAIINNLNLANMPKDEELLAVFEQLLDTITFFRIQEKEKQFINEEYQRKMKNAIWSSAPNFVALITGNKLNVKQLLFQMALLGGVTYMNYRKNKAEYQLDRDKKLWELQRTAIEQFNSLRKKLFDAAWRLSENWEDSWRLTEKQIHQYNMILIDSNATRRYERLKYISDKFEAYPPFWYFLGSAALEVSRENERLSKEKREELKNEAQRAFDEFNELKENDILRTDPISTQCQLEYVNLLYDQNDSSYDLLPEQKKTIKARLDMAVRMSGDALDAIQICAIEYLAIGEKASAKKYLKHLVTEDFNKETNIQILSELYANEACQKIINGEDSDAISEKGEYDILFSLCGFGYRDYMFPFPESKDLDLDKYIAQLKDRAVSNYVKVIKSYIEKYGVEFNSLIPCLDKRATDKDEYYSTAQDAISERYQLVEKISKRPIKWRQFVNEMSSLNFAEEHIHILNELYGALEGLRFLTDTERENLFNDIAINFMNDEIRDNYESIQMHLDDDSFTFEDDYLVLDNMSYDRYVDVFAEHLKEYGIHFINELGEEHDNGAELDMSAFGRFDNDLYDFCIRQNLNTDILKPDRTPDYNEEQELLIDASLMRFSTKMLGGNLEKAADISKIKAEMLDVIKRALESGLMTDQSKLKYKVNMLVGDKKTAEFSNYTKKHEKNGQKRSNIIAVLDDTTPLSNKDIVFYITGFKTKFYNGEYKEFPIEKNGIKLGLTNSYQLEGVDINKLQELFIDLKKYSDQIKVITSEIKEKETKEKSHLNSKQLKSKVVDVLKENFHNDSEFQTQGALPIFDQKPYFVTFGRNKRIDFYNDRMALVEKEDDKKEEKVIISYSKIKSISRPNEYQLCLELNDGTEVIFNPGYESEVVKNNFIKISKAIGECITLFEETAVE